MPLTKLESDHAKRLIAEHLRRIGEAKGRTAQSAAFDAMTKDVATLTDPASVLVRFLSGDTNSRRFALELSARWEPPIPPSVQPLLIEQLGKNRFSSRLRLQVAAKIIRSIPADSLYIPRIVQAFERKVAPSHAAARLRRLEELVPPLLVLRQRRQELEEESLANCPRCQARLPRAEFVRHVWEQHQLLVERGRVLEPWHAIEEWLRDYARHGTKDLLYRSCDLAQSLDPAGGLTRLHQLLMSAGAGDEEADTLLRAEATTKNAGLCPHCFGMVPAPVPGMPDAVIVGPSRVEGHGYRVELGPGTVLTQLFATTPDVVVFDGPEPAHTFTHRGAVLLLLGPLLILATFLAVLPPIKGVPPIIPVGALLSTTFGLYLGMRWYRSNVEAPRERIIDHAWGVLAPRLMQERFHLADAEFIAGLAIASKGHGDGEYRADELRRVASMLLRDRHGQALLAPVQALQIDDAARDGADDVLMIADRLGECFTGPMLLEHGEHLLGQLPTDDKDRTRRARLRVLLLARAFQAELEADDLHWIGRACPKMGALYASEDRDGLTRLRLLWLYRTKRLWQRVGSATAVFDLARYPTLAEQYLKQRPDLLLFQASAEGEQAPILICEEGIVYRDSLITRRDESIYVRAKSVVYGGGFELFIGKQKYWFRNDPIILAQRLTAWAEFLFDELLPRAKMLLNRRSVRGDRLLKQKRTTCPMCRHDFLWVHGDIGLPSTTLEEDE